MSCLHYLTQQEWKKLGKISIIALFTPSIFFVFCILILSIEVNVIAEIGFKAIFRMFSFISIGYSAIYSIICFLFMYAKGITVYKKLITTNFVLLIGFIFFFILIIIFGPQG